MMCSFHCCSKKTLFGLNSVLFDQSLLQLCNIIKVGSVSYVSREACIFYLDSVKPRLHFNQKFKVNRLRSLAHMLFSEINS